MIEECQQYWSPSENEKCEFCKKIKFTTLEMIGPTTTRSCLDCQKIAPAFRVVS